MGGPLQEFDSQDDFTLLEILAQEMFQFQLLDCEVGNNAAGKFIARAN